MSYDVQTADRLLASLRDPLSADRRGEIGEIVGALVEDSLALHHVVNGAVRQQLEVPTGSDTGWLADLVASLPRKFISPPNLADAAPEANLCETLLLAFAATSCPINPQIHDAAERAIRETSPQRLGHVVAKREREERDVQVLPALAALLAMGDRERVRRDAAELSWDRKLQRQAASSSFSCADLARVALGSPARLLARVPEAVAVLAAPSVDGQADGSALRVLAAVMDGDGATSPRAVPGHRRGSSDMHEESPLALLRALDAAPTAWRRSEALLGLLLLPRTGDVGGVELDLHRRAAAHIAVALQPDASLDARNAEPSFRPGEWLRFEVAALRHGAAIVARMQLPDSRTRVRAAWLLGDWIGRVLRESPFFGADPELLAARIETQLPTDLPEEEEALWPARVGVDATSLRLDELWLMHTLCLLRARDPAREPWEPPGAVLDGLRYLGGRLVNVAEQRAEEQLEEEHDALGWPGPHLAPPLTARWLLHTYRAEWLGRLPAEAQCETIDWLERWLDRGRAERGSWVMLALYREGARIGSLAERARKLWISAASRQTDFGDALGPFCLWGSTHLDALSPAEADTLAHLAGRTPARWRVGVLMTIAEASRTPMAALPAREALLDLLDSTGERSLRLPAAVAVLQLGRKLPEGEREAFLDRAVARLGADLRLHPNIRVELKRVGRAA